jgi:Tfp pilus assembly protein PilV
LTLVEVLVATVFLAVCSGTIIDTVTNNLAQMARIKRRAVALTLIEDEMERIRAECRTADPGIDVNGRFVTLPGRVTATLGSMISSGVGNGNRKVSTIITWSERKFSRTYFERLSLEAYYRTPER